MSTARASASAPFHRAGPIRPPACMFSRPSVLLYSVGADVLIRPLSGFCGVGGGFAAAAASFFLSDQKETKESPGADSPCQGEMSRSDRGGRDRGFWERLSACALVFHEPLSPGPPFLRECRRGTPAVAAGAETSGRVSKGYHCRSAQLTKQVLLQDEKLLSFRTYTADGGRAATRAAPTEWQKAL